jgi:integrase
MSSRSPVKRVRRRGRVHLVIDFFFIDASGRKQRFRRDATVQRAAAANTEAKRLIDLAAATGSPFPKAPAQSFAAFVDGDYTALFLSRLRPGTRIRYLGILKQGVRYFFGPMRLDGIGPLEARRYATELMKRGVSPKGHIDFVSSVLRAAQECALLEDLPKLPRYKSSEKLPDAPSAEHILDLLDVATGWLRTAIALAAFAGLRQGEVRALQAGDVDFDANVIYLRRAFSEDELVPSPKGKRQRVVPMAPPLRAILHEVVKGKQRCAFLVTTRDGGVPRRQHVYDRLIRLERRYGLRQWSFHALRHAFCTRLLRVGATIEAVRMLAGHRELRTTQRYVHASAIELQSAVARLSGNSVATPSEPLS